LQENQHESIFVLGSGSNMLLTQDINALVIHMGIKGISIVNEDEDYVTIECNGGEIWHDFVLYSIKNNYGGLENMSLIPGNVGTTPIQNIGAYGKEIKDHFVQCTAIHITNLSLRTFTLEECKFGYRESIFKQEEKGNYIITSVVFKLTKRNHKISIEYGDIKAELSNNNIENPTIKDVSNAVIAIRNSKLPNPKELGNSGSFFKNPVISKSHFEKVQSQFPDIRFFEVGENEIKVPAGWLIENAGLKGYRIGDAGVHKNQALVLVNYGTATGKDILELSKFVQNNVYNKYGIEIEAEVNII
jgi:UDP-N-acetylmuramate dehydrogenase